MIEQSQLQQLQQLQIDRQPNPDSSFPQAQPPQILTLPQITSPISGMCQQFISKKQLNARQLNPYQIPTPAHKNWEPMACHFRNIQYTNQTVRTPETLAACFDAICLEYLPYYREVFGEEVERKRLELFLYDRVRSIRCELYVQGKFQPRLQMRLVKIILFLETMIGQPIQTTGIEYFLNQEIKQTLLSDQSLKPYYYQALQYSIFLSKKQKLPSLLSTHSNSLFQSPTLPQILQRKLKICNNNYYTFLVTLAKYDNIYVRLILWSQMRIMRDVIIMRYKKAKINQKASILCKFLGYRRMDGWINVGKAEEWERLEKNKVVLDLEIKLWVREADLMQALKDLQKSVS